MSSEHRSLRYYVEIKCQLDATDDFYCRSYCLLNMFRALLCPSSGAREYYTSGCCLCFGFQVVGMVWSWGLCVRFATQPSAPHHTDNLETKAPNTTGSNHLYNTLELLMMGIIVHETCWASNKICNKNHPLHLVGILFPHINDDARSKPHQVYVMLFSVLMIRTTGSLKMLLFFYQTIWFKISRHHNLVTVGHKNLNFTYANYLSVKNPCTYRHA